MARSERFTRQHQDRPQDEHPGGHKRLAARVLRRDGAPLAISLLLHVLALLLIAPWLVMRTIPGPQVEVEVMLEEDTEAPPASQPEKAARLRPLVKVERPLAQSLRPRLAQLQPLQSQPMQSTPSLVQLPSRPTPEAQAEPGPSGRGAPAPRETAGLASPASAASSEAAGLSAPTRAALASAAAPSRAGDTPLQHDTAETRPVAPPPSLGSTPQPSARAAAAPSRPGEDREDGPVNLAGPVPQAQAAQPEFRQAARLGGSASLRGGSQAPDDGLARQAGSPGQTALLASRAVPQSQPGASGGGRTAAAAAPAPRSSGQGSVAAAERANPVAQTAQPGAGQSSVPASRSPAVSGLATSGTGSGSRTINPVERSTVASQAVQPGTGQAAVLASRSPAAGGQGSAGSGSGSRTISPGERGSGLQAAPPPGTSGSGAAAVGAGAGASLAGEGRAQQLAGSGSAAREAAAPLRAATGGGAAAMGGSDSSSAQLSGRAEPPAQAQPVNEARAAPMQNVQPSGQARVIEERFSAPALKVASPRSICELPLLFAGFDRKPIPKGLDSINATAASLQGEIPPRHHPANQLPRYPLQALGLRAQGRTIVRAEIRPDGLIGQLWIKQSSGYQVLDIAALETVRFWRFVPAQRHGLAVATWMDVPIEYKLP